MPPGSSPSKQNGQGTFDNPQLDATLQVPQIDIQNQTIQDVNLQMNVANHLATANLSSTAVGTAIRANAKVNLSGDYRQMPTLDTQPIPLQPLFAIYAPEQAADLTGETEVHATLHGPLKKQKLLEAQSHDSDAEAGLQQHHPISRDVAHPGWITRTP